MNNFEFTAWSIYTGPKNLKSIINDPACSWIVGEWDGINSDCSALEIQKDIDARINLITDAFTKALKYYKATDKYFVIPEFFFRSKQGPYPFIKLEGDFYPLEYIEFSLKVKLLNIIINSKLQGNFGIIIGSVLTSNISNYDEFLNSESVTERLAELNSCLSDKLKSRFNTPSNEKKFTAWHRQPSWGKTKKDFLASNNSFEFANELDSLNNFMKKSRSNPLCTVRNRGVFFSFNSKDPSELESFVYEKQYESTVDLTMGIFNGDKIEHGGMITEWIANYPSISIVDGDKQTDQYSTNSRMNISSIPNMDIGIEICLDHRKQRLRRTVDMCINNGAAANNEAIALQIIPSGGMQILDYSVAANANSLIFNADGCDKIYEFYGNESSVIKQLEYKGITCGVYTLSIQSPWIGKDNQPYYSHSQIAFANSDSKIEGFSYALGINNEKALTYNGSKENPSNDLTDSFDAVKIIDGFKNPSELFGASTGELHCYSSLSKK